MSTKLYGKMSTISLSNEWKLIIALSIFKLFIHFLTNSNYEPHSDSYLYASMYDKLDWGYLSVPPSIAIFAKISFILFGKTSFALGFFPALLGATSVIIIGAAVKEMGGKKTAIAIACFAFILAPSFLRSNTMLQPVSFDQFYWLLSSYLLIRLLNTNNPKIWIYIGIVFGFAFMNKYSITFYAFAFLISLLISSKRRLLFSRFTIYGLILGLVIILPNIFWQATHNWPVIYHMKELYNTQLIHVQISQFFTMQFLMNLPAIGIWLFGLIYLLFLKPAKDYKILGWIYLIIVAEMLLFKGKFYYITGIYSILIVAGGVAIEKYCKKNLRILKWGIVSFMILCGLFFLPYSLPILKENKMIQFCKLTKSFGITEPLRWNNGKIKQIPQDFAEMSGYRKMSEIVLEKFNQLNKDEKNDCFIYAGTYSIAGALKFYGKESSLPDAISYQDNFILWAPETMEKNIMIYVNYHRGEYLKLFSNISKIGEITNVNSILYGVEIFLCKNPTPAFYEYYSKTTSEMKNNFR